jgi:glycosyltransferase involved in cell wall biosynthesis
VRLLGRRTDIPNLLNAADAFVLASAWEGMPNAVLEAAATALPVVSTCVGDVPHIIQDGNFGYLAPPRNSEALAQAMHRLMLLDPRERQRMGSAARQHMMDNYELEVAVDRWEALYKQMIESCERLHPRA